MRVTTAAQLEAILGEPLPAAANKVRTALHELDREWLAAASLCMMATSNAAGDLDVSPKGDPAGFTKVLDASTIVIPERPGNRRADGFHNLLENPHVGLIYLVPGRGDTLRINGTAEIVTDGDFFDDLVVSGHRPVLALVVKVSEVFYHCSKAFLRSKTWDPTTWNADAAPRRAIIAKTVERPNDDLAALEEYYGPEYAKKIYG